MPYALAAHALLTPRYALIKQALLAGLSGALWTFGPGIGCDRELGKLGHTWLLLSFLYSWRDSSRLAMQSSSAWPSRPRTYCSVPYW